MADILDLIAKVSWQTNQAELDKLNKAIDKQDEALTELIRKGQRLEQARSKADNPAKVREINKQLEANKKAMDSLTKATENQGKATLDLVKKQKELAKAINETTDPKQVRQLLSEFKKVEQQLKTTEKSAGGLASKLGGFGQSLLAGVGLGAGTFGIGSIIGFASSQISVAISEFENATRQAESLRNILKNFGQESYFDDLISDAERLSNQFAYLDSADIVEAQKKLITYGKLTKEEIKQLTPTIIDLAANLRISVPEATEKVVMALEGNGRELKKYGISLKDASDFTSRLSLVQTDLANKVKGSADTFAQSSEGIKATAEQDIKDVLSTYGEAASKIELFFKSSIAGLYTFISEAAKSSKQVAKEEADKLATEYKVQAESLSRADLEIQQKQNRAREAEVKASEKRIAEIRSQFEAEARKLNPSQRRLDQLADAIDNEQSLLTKNQIAIKAYNDAVNSYELREREKANELKRINEEKTNKEIDKSAKEKADKEAERLKALRELLKKDRQELDQFYLSADQKEVARINAHYDELEKQAKGHADILKTIAENRASALLHIERKHEFEMTKLGSDSIDNKKKDEAEKIDLTKNTAYIAMQLRVEEQQDEIKKQQEKKQRQAEELQMLFEQAQVAASVAQDLISIEQEKNDRLIGLQQERIASARDSASVSLKIEEDRLQELLEKRQRYERAQRTIDAAVIVANQAVAISQAIRAITTSSTLGPAAIAANVIAIIAGLASSLAAVRSATADIPQFREGGYTGDGNPDAVSTTLGARPYTYHKREFVMDEELTSKHRDLFEGLHKRDMVVKKLDDGQFYITRNGLDTTRLIDDHISIKNQMQTEAIVYQLNAINERLSQREVSITNTFDSNGFGNVIATQLGRIQINKKLRWK